MSGEKNAALRAASVIYAKRVCGMAPPCDTFYLGDFDVESVAKAAPLPKDTSEYSHRAAWTGFRNLFEEEWRAI